MTIIGAVYGNLTPLEALNDLSVVQPWKVYMSAKDPWEEISQGPPRGAEGGKRRSVGENNNTYKTDMRIKLILIRDLHKGNKLCLISPSNFGKEINYESWRIYESRSMTLKLS